MCFNYLLFLCIAVRDHLHVSGVGLFTVIGNYGSGINVGVTVVNATASWSDAYQNCWSYQSQDLFAETSVTSLLEHLLDINQMLLMLNWPPGNHLWIGFASNGSTNMMAEGGSCVSGPSLPITFTSGVPACVLLNVSATTASNIIYKAPCEEQHSYLCEAPNLGQANSTRYLDLTVLAYLVPNYVTSVLNSPNETSCETEMKNRKMSFAAEFYRAYNLCHVHKKTVFEFPVTVTMDSTNTAITAYVKTGGYTVKVLQKNEIPTSHPEKIQHCFGSGDTTTIATTEVFTTTYKTSVEPIVTTASTTYKSSAVPIMTTETSTYTTSGERIVTTESTTYTSSGEPIVTTESTTYTSSGELIVTTELTSYQSSVVPVVTTGSTTYTTSQMMDPTTTSISLGEDTTSSCVMYCCVPQASNATNATEKANRLVTDLRLNKTRLNSYKRRHHSVKDSRMSAAVIGYCGVVILMAACLTIIIPDVSLVIKCIQARKLRHGLRSEVELTSYKRK